MKTHIFAIDPGIANTGICYVRADKMDAPKRTTIKTDPKKDLVSRITKIEHMAYKFLETVEVNENDRIIIVIEDYVIRTTSSKHQEKTIKLIGVLQHSFGGQAIMLRPGSTGWQSKVKKEFNRIMLLKGKGWNAHTRDCYAMCYYAKKYLIKTKKKLDN